MTFAFIVDSVEFTPDVVAGKTSLGGSESAGLGLARALVFRGHAVSIYATKLAASLNGTLDATGLTWWDYGEFATANQFIEYDVVVALRVFAAFGQRPVQGRLRLLWNQDLLVSGDMQSGVMAIAWALDHCVYVSQYHRAQWEHTQRELASIGWVTRNGYDPADLPASRTKDPNRIIHISRPERGLGPLLAMWPELRRRKPTATLQICRYSSMYDTGAGSWSEVCASFDEQVAALNDKIGGITYLGELTKPQLYQAISDAAVMWYPGVSSFAETSCIAAIEAQACGTPFVGSRRGALPETVPNGILIPGEDASPEYRTASIQAVLDVLDGCATSSFAYRSMVKAGQAHVATYDYATIAAEWDAQIQAWFEERYETKKLGVLRQLLREDDHTSAVLVAEEIRNDEGCGIQNPVTREACEAIDLCHRVIAGKEHSPESYGHFALHDVLNEAEKANRFHAVIPAFELSKNVLDIACGNGSFAIALAWKYPEVHVHGIDFSPANIARARDAAITAGVADRVTYEERTIYDFETHELCTDMQAWLAERAGTFDGLFCGEFIEHTANYRGVIDGLEVALTPGSSVVYTCPHGACQDIADPDIPLQRAHVHRFHHDDVQRVWGPKGDLKVAYLASGGVTPRGLDIGSWIIGYQYQPGRVAGLRADRIRRTRPMPTLTVGIITKNAANDLGRCLTSVRRVAEQIIVGDTGSTDRTVTLAQEFGAEVFSMAPVEDQPEGFAGARNQVLARARGDWFLWIDADEQLMHPAWLRCHLDSTVFNGFVLRQTHLYLEGAPTYDIPVRVFRQTGRVRFFGCIHEQPQDGDCNQDIEPVLDVASVVIAHWGYLTAAVREEKRTKRNLPLFIKDQQVFPDRLLGKVLCVREATLQSDAIRAAHGGRMTNEARDGYLFAIRIHTAHFDDPRHKYHHLSRPWYELALQHLEIGTEHEIAQAGRIGGLQHRRSKAERVWVRDVDEYARVMAFRTQGVIEKLRPKTFLTDPDDPRLGLVAAPVADQVPA